MVGERLPWSCVCADWRSEKEVKERCRTFRTVFFFDMLALVGGERNEPRAGQFCQGKRPCDGIVQEWHAVEHTLLVVIAKSLSG